MSEGTDEAALREIDALLDGHVRTYSCRRWKAILILGGGWFYAYETFLEAFITNPVSVQDCECATPVEWSNATLSEACRLCADAGADLRCTGPETSIATSFGLWCASDWMRSIAPTFYFIGTALASFCSGVADRVGRRPAFVVSRALSALIFFATAAAPTFSLYLLAKLLIGFTTTIGTLSAYPLACEIVGVRMRTRLTIELWCYVWAASCSSLALFAYLLRASSWRVQVVALAVPYALLALGYAAWVPESPRWCIAHGKRAEAREMRHGIATRSLRTCESARGVLQAHAIVRRLTESDSRLLSYRTGTPITRRAEMRVPLLAPVDPRHVGTHTTLPRGRHSELPVVCEAGGNVGASSTGSPADRAPRVDEPDASAADGADAATPAAAATAAAATDGLPPVSPPTSAEDAVCTRAVRDEPPRGSTWRPRALELFSTARSSRALLIEMYLWATVSLSYYAIGYNAGNLSEQVHLNFLLISLPLFFSAYASSAAMDHPRIGRCGAAVGYFGLIAVSIGIGAIWPSAATYSSIVGNFAGEAAFNVVYIQGAELFPTKLRASGLGLCSAAARFGSFFSAPLPGLLGSTATLTIISAMCAAAVLATRFGLPETHGHGLAERLPGS